MPFDRSQIRILDTAPFKWATPPSMGVAGVKGQTLDGVFILMSDELVTSLRETMTAAEKTEVAPWVNRYTAEQCALWNVPVWAGQDSAVYWPTSPSQAGAQAGCSTRAWRQPI
jgi:hypothetical protein